MLDLDIRITKARLSEISIDFDLSEETFTIRDITATLVLQNEKGNKITQVTVHKMGYFEGPKFDPISTRSLILSLAQLASDIETKAVEALNGLTKKLPEQASSDQYKEDIT